MSTQRRVIGQCWLGKAVRGGTAGGCGLANGVLRQCAPDPQVPRCASYMYHAPHVRFVDRFVCGGILVTEAGTRRAGRGSQTRVLTMHTSDRPVSPPLRADAPHSTACPALRVTGIKNRNGARGRGRGNGTGG